MALRVAIATQDFGFGASLARDAAILARELVARGIEVHCYCDQATRTDDVEGVVFHHVAPVVRSRGRFAYAADYGSFALAMTRALRPDRGNYDIVQVNEGAGWECDVLRVQSIRKAEQLRWPTRGGRGYPLARVRARAAPVTRPQIGVARAVEWMQFHRSPAPWTAVVTDQVAADVARVHGAPSDRITVIPCAVELALFASAGPNGMRGSLGVEESTPLLLFVGHDFERKGLREAIRALAGLGDERAQLAVIGNGDSRPYLREARAAGVAERVLFVGPTNAPERVFAASDLLLLPTREDVWGMTIIEAMAAGIPVVTTDAAGAAPVVRAAGAGVVVDDPAELAPALDSLVADPGRRREMGQRGRAAAERFGAGAQADAFLALYDRVLERKRAA